jgi:hypothetical protein
MEIHEDRLRLSDPDSLSVTPRCLALAADMLKAKVAAVSNEYRIAVLCGSSPLGALVRCI